jgi:hypothetical protein
MPLNNYSALQESIASWLMRDDLTAAIPDFIALAEADMNQRLRLRAMLTTAEYPLSSLSGLDAAGGALPADCLAVRSVELADYGHLSFAADAETAQFSNAYRGGDARWFSIDGNSLVVSPRPLSSLSGDQVGAGAVTLRYYARIPALSDSNPTNYVLTANPALYLYGSLLQSSPYLLDDARMQTWGSLYESAASALQGADDAAEYPGPLVIRSSDHW